MRKIPMKKTPWRISMRERNFKYFKVDPNTHDFPVVRFSADFKIAFSRSPLQSLPLVILMFWCSILYFDYYFCCLISPHHHHRPHHPRTKAFHLSPLWTVLHPNSWLTAHLHYVHLVHYQHVLLFNLPFLFRRKYLKGEANPYSCDWTLEC